MVKPPSVTESDVLDALDEQIIHGIQIFPRVNFATLGEVIGVSENTIARRYRRLRREGLIRVTLKVDPDAIGRHLWHVRVRAQPEAAQPIAYALARRDDVSWVSIDVSGWEIKAVVFATDGEQARHLITRALPKSQSVHSVDVVAVIHRFGDAKSDDWSQWAHRLTDCQAQQLRALSPRPDPRVTTVTGTLEPVDRELIAALTKDGRTSLADVARSAGTTIGKASRRIDALVATGTVFFDVDVATHASGLGAEFTLWLAVEPRHLHTVGTTLSEHPDIPFVGAITGSFNLIASVVTRRVNDVYALITSALAAVDGVTRYELVLHDIRIKSAQALIADGRLTSHQ